MTVLIVEGVPGLRRVLRGHLYDHGVDVVTAGSVAAARGQVTRREFMAVIVDLVLPDGSGLEVLDALRVDGSVAHVIVMSDSTDAADRAGAFEHGADDYVVKPFLLRQLAARVLAVRRVVDPDEDDRLHTGGVAVDLRAREARVDDRLLDLTAKEFDLLAFFVARPGYTFSKSDLLRAVWRADARAGSATVADHVRRLRRKIEVDPSRPCILRTVPGTGYRLERPVQAAAAVAALGPDGGSLVHVQGWIVDADPATATLLGFAGAADLVGHEIFEFATSGDMAPTRQRMVASEGRSRPRTQLIDLEHTDGTQTSVEVSSEQVVWDGGAAERLRFTPMPDVSARLRRLVTGVLSEVTDAVIITDLHFHLRSWNTAAERLYGWREDEVVGRHMLDVVHFGGDGGALAATWDDLEANGRWRGESEHITRDGSTIDVLTSTTLVRDDDGAPVLIVSVNRPGGDRATTREAQESFDDDAIRLGLANDEFELYFQPVVSLEDGTVVAREALVRWNHPTRGLLAPDAFIAAAERSGAIVELGSVVFEKACLHAAEWLRAGHDIDLAINLSGRQLSDPWLIEHMEAVLMTSGLDASNLWLEVTETSLVEEVERASEVLHRLADLGVGISIDDFGTGWASLTYLRSFPVHALKIDRSFIAGLGHNANDTAIVRSILALGADLDLFVIAEGIETAAQRDALQQMGCTMGQGYLYGRPAPPSAGAIAGAPTARAMSAASDQRRVRAHQRRNPLRPEVDPVCRLSTAQVVGDEPSGASPALHGGAGASYPGGQA